RAERKLRTVRSAAPGGQWRAVEMNMLPMRALPLPNARLFEAGAHRQAVRTHALVQPHIGNDGHVSQHADAGRTHGRIVTTRDAAEVEVEAMELYPLHELAERLGLERRQGRIAKLLIGGPIRG